MSLPVADDAGALQATRGLTSIEVDGKLVVGLDERPRQVGRLFGTPQDSMSDWVDAMLDVQRLQVGQLPLELTRVDLVNLAWTVAEELQQTTRLHHIRVIASGHVPPPIAADRRRLRQVLTHLIENAIKYAAGGMIQVRVGVQPDSDRAIVAIHDEGPGVGPGDLDRIFAPFEQSARRGMGLGLGLYLSRQIARLHGGDVWAESRGRMNGGTFVLALPMTSPERGG